MPSLYAKPKTITPEDVAACRRVADYLRRVAVPFLADIYADRNEQTEALRADTGTPFVEFYLTFIPSPVAKFDRRLVQGIRDFAAARISPAGLKAIVDEYIEAHTVVWIAGVPHWKVKELNGENVR